MDDLVTFLRARYNEQARAARAAMHAPDSRWRLDGEGGLVETDTGGSGYFAAGPWGTGIADDHAAHMVTWQPAAVLDLVDVGQRILDRYLAGDTDMGSAHGRPVWNEPESQGLGEDVLRLLGLLFAGHPDYRPEWAPAPS